MRRHFLIATILFATFLALGTETLSLFRLLAFCPILALWCAAIIACVLWWLKDRTRPPRVFPWRTLALTEWIMGASLASLLVSAAISGLLCPPNTWDAMMYHLPRQIHWIQQFSVEHFPTHKLLLLHREPFAEFVGTHLMILTDTDYYLSFIQWFALVGCLAAVSLMARQLGCDRRGQLFVSLFVATIPIVYLAATNAKNDLVFGLWYVILAWLTLTVYQEKRCTFPTSVLIGCVLGLFVMTKGAAYLLGPPLLIFTGLGILRATKRSAWKPFAAITVIALALNFGHYARNYELFGSPFGPKNTYSLFLNEDWSPAQLLSRWVRELSLQMGTPIENVNRVLQESIEKLHLFLGINTNDPRSSLGSRDFEVLAQMENEYMAPAPLHLALAGLLLILGIVFRRDLRQRAFWLLLTVPISSFLLFSSVSKWEPYLNRRLHIPILLLLAPLIGRVFSHERMKRIVFPVALILLLGMVTTLRWNPRSLIGPALAFRSVNKLLFTFEPGLQYSYEAAAKYTNSLSRKTSLGLHVQGLHHYLYPLMRLLRRNLYEPHFVAVEVQNVSQRLQSNYSPPNVVLSVSSGPAEIDSIAGQKYVVGKRFDSVTVLVQEENSLPY